MEHKFNPGDRVVFIGEPGRYMINGNIPRMIAVNTNIDISGMHGKILRVETYKDYELPFYGVKFDDVFLNVIVYEPLLSFEYEYECSDDAAIDQGSINLFLGI